MSDLLDSWFKAREEESFFERLSATGLQAMKDYLYGDITPADAAIKYTANFNIQGLHDTSLDIHLHYLLIPAIQISSFDIQGKLVKLLAAIRDLRSKSWKASQSIFPKHISALQYVLPNFEFNLVDEFVGLLGHALGVDLYYVDCYSEWININVFCARLTALNVVDPSYMVNKLNDRILGEDHYYCREEKVRENPVVFDLIVSAAAQHMIYSASHVYRIYDSEESRTSGYPIDWQKWKEGFESAQLVTKDPKVKKYAQLAVAGMQLAEWKFNKSHRQKRNLLASQGMDQTKLDGNTLGQESNEQAFQHGKKRGLDEAFSQSHIVEMTAVAQSNADEDVVE